MGRVARRPDRPGPRAVLRLLRGEPAGSRGTGARRHGVDRAAGARRSAARVRRAFTSPFREKLLFGKLSFQPAQGQHAEVTYNWRNETDIRGFGGRARATASRPPRTSGTASIRSRASGRWRRHGFLNEAYLSYQRYRWNPRRRTDIVGENFQGLLRIGGRDTEQFIVQQRVSLRNDFTPFLKWHGSHTAKVGGVVSFADYDVSKLFNGNPLFTYRGDISWDFPARRASASAIPI